jgi:polyisoprenyl-phosphate glycosyltransferase
MSSAEVPSLSIIIPVFNEESGVARLLSALRSFRELHSELSIEVVFVDDHSTDSTPDLLAKACGSESGLRYLRLTRNSGSHIAILAGMSKSCGECVVFMAADLQDPLELLPQMRELWRQGFRVVWAVRERREKIGITERVVARIFYWLMNRLSDLNFPPTGTDFALLDRRVVKSLLESVGANPSIVADIASLGYRDTHVSYVKQARQVGKSKWTMRMRLKAFADAFVGHTFAPIRLMSYVGLTCATVGFLGAIVTAVLRLTGVTQAAGWAALMVTILTVGGIQMTMLGVLGEYLWRALSEVRRKHLYIIEEEISCSEPASERPQRSGQSSNGASSIPPAIHGPDADSPIPISKEDANP